MWCKSIAIWFIFSIACSPTPTVPQSCATQSMSRILILSAGVSGRLCGYTLISMVMTAALTIIIPSSRGQHQIRLCEPVVSMSSFALCFVSNKAFFYLCFIALPQAGGSLATHTKNILQLICRNNSQAHFCRHSPCYCRYCIIMGLSGGSAADCSVLFTWDALMKTEYDFHRLMAAYEMTHNPNETHVKEICQFV